MLGLYGIHDLVLTVSSIGKSIDNLLFAFGTLTLACKIYHKNATFKKIIANHSSLEINSNDAIFYTVGT